jgi:hypothetical protein
MRTNYEAKYIPEPNSGCWLWLGQVNQHGYGRTRLASGRSQVAHRAVYEAYHNIVVPADLELDHLCYVRCCVNPDHLEPVTRSVNVRRAIRHNRGRNISEADSRCPNGHSMVGDNICVRKQGKTISIICRTCARAARLRWRNSPKGRLLQSECDARYLANRKRKTA